VQILVEYKFYFYSNNNFWIGKFWTACSGFYIEDMVFDYTYSKFLAFTIQQVRRGRLFVIVIAEVRKRNFRKNTDKR